jgi:hypothetical protein
MLAAMARGTRIHPLVPAVLALVVVGVLVLVIARSRGGDDDAAAPATTAPTTTSTTTSSTTTTTTVPDPVPVEDLVVPGPAVDAPLAYRITYEVVENGLPRVEEWTVRRPYESLVLSRRDDTLLSGTSTSRALLQTYVSAQDGWLPVQPELHRAAFDQHPAAAVAAMEVLGLVERAGTEEHLGRTCSVYRTGQPPSAGEPTAPGDEERTDVCIDDAGLVLHEVWEIGGSVVVERTATALELEPEIDPASFTPGPPVEDADGLAQLFSTIAVQADGETLERLRTVVPVPEGYVEDGAVFRAADGGGPGGSAPGSAEIVRFYSSGPSLLEVAEVFVDGSAEVASPAGALVEIDGWAEVWFVPGFRNSVLRGRTSETSYVELRHHDVAFLFDVIRSLQPAE